MGLSDEIDYGLKFYSEVLGLEELHWGYFPRHSGISASLQPEKHFIDGENRHACSLRSFKKAQEDYTLHLLSYIPEPVSSILDVGCGLGKMAKLLMDRGYKVTCISNDRYQETFIKQKYPDLQFVRTKFEDFNTTEHFDLLLLSESVQYLSLDAGIKNAKRLLNPAGYLLIADYFRKSNNRYYRTCKILSNFIKVLKENSFSLCKEEDITEFVIPTLWFADYLYANYVLPSIAIIRDYANSQIHRLIITLAKILFKKQLTKLAYYIGEHTSQKLNSSIFREKLSYVIQLWQMKKMEW